MVEFELNGRILHMALTGDGYFDIREAVEDETKLIEAISPNTREAWGKTCRVAAILAKGGELQRRAIGEDAERTMTEGEIRVLCPVSRAADLKRAVIDAVVQGMRREVEDESPRDLVLEAINNEKK